MLICREIGRNLSVCVQNMLEPILDQNYLRILAYGTIAHKNPEIRTCFSIMMDPLQYLEFKLLELELLALSNSPGIMVPTGNLLLELDICYLN